MQSNSASLNNIRYQALRQANGDALTDANEKAHPQPIALNNRRFGDVNLGDRVPPVVAGGRQFSGDAVKSAVDVNVPLSWPLLCVTGGGATRWARDVRAELVVLLSACLFRMRSPWSARGGDRQYREKCLAQKVRSVDVLRCGGQVLVCPSVCRTCLS